MPTTPSVGTKAATATTATPTRKLGFMPWQRVQNYAPDGAVDPAKENAGQAKADVSVSSGDESKGSMLGAVVGGALGFFVLGRSLLGAGAGAVAGYYLGPSSKSSNVDACLEGLTPDQAAYAKWLLTAPPGATLPGDPGEMTVSSQALEAAAAEVEGEGESPKLAACLRERAAVLKSQGK